MARIYICEWAVNKENVQGFQYHKNKSETFYFAS